MSLSNTENACRCLFQRCGAGFFRTWSGECSPCDCNGHSQECLDGSGFCLVSPGRAGENGQPSSFPTLQFFLENILCQCVLIARGPRGSA